MKAAEIERTYQEMMVGRDEPDVMWILGRTLKAMSRECGKEVSADTDGHPIKDEEMYCVTSEGIWLVE